MGKQKTARVFISSTFRDMHAERDYLSKVIFPEVRETLKHRGIYLVDVDLRWGITEEESEKGETLKICLDEIHNSRPFFIGILGHRYGWVPDQAPATMINSEEDRFKWENKLKSGEHSVTALEIYHGVLNNTDQKPRSFFYFRDDAFISDIPTEKQADVKDTDALQQQKLKELKKRIQSTYADLPENLNNYSPVYDGLRINWLELKQSGALNKKDMELLEEYAKDNLIDNEELKAISGELRDKIFEHAHPYLKLESLQAFGEQVKEDLLTSIYDEFAEDEQEEDPLNLETLLHERFADDKTRNFVGRTEELKSISAYISEDVCSPLAVIGQAGSGKSSLMARAFINCTEQQDAYVIPHFVGCSPISVDIYRTLNHFCQLLVREFAIELEDGIPDDYNKLKECFSDLLSKAAENRGVIIFIDALNQLSRSRNSHQLDWLPEQLPNNVKIVVSALPGEVMDSITAMQLPRVEVGVLEMKHRKEIVLGWLEPYRKHNLSDEQMDMILKKEESGKPLYLTIVAEELRLFGEYEKINSKIKGFAQNIEGLFEQVFDRLEKDNDPQLVKQTMCLFECSRFGLLETEMLQLLKPSVEEALAAGLIQDENENYELPRTRWSAIFLGVSSYFRSPGKTSQKNDNSREYMGLIDFFHRQLSKAVKNRYLSKEEDVHYYHKLLAQYFHEHAEGKHDKFHFTGHDARGFGELPYHRLMSGSRDVAEELLTDFTFLMGKARTGLVMEILSDYEMLDEQ
jgi:telomerase protein component 1